MESRVLADTFHDNYLSMADVESVPFWISKVLEPLAKAAFDSVAADIKQDYPAFDSKKAWNDVKKSLGERIGAYEDM